MLNDPTIDHMVSMGWSPFSEPNRMGDWYEPTADNKWNWTEAGKRFKNNGYTRNDLEGLLGVYPYMQRILDILDARNYDWDAKNLTKDEMQKLVEMTPEWAKTTRYLYDPTEGLQRRKDYIARRRGIAGADQDEDFLKTWEALGKFVPQDDGTWTYEVNPDKLEEFNKTFKTRREDGILGTMFDVLVPSNPRNIRYLLDEKGKPTGDILTDEDAKGYEQVGPSRMFYTAGSNRFSPGYNNNISYWRKKTEDSSASGNGNDKSNYLTVGWQPKTDLQSYMLGAMPGLTGLGMMLGRGVPDMSETDNAVAAYERSTGTMIAPHLTHGLIRPAIIDPRVTYNNMNAQRLGTNRLLRNTDFGPSQGAYILANDNNYISRMGQAMINNWKENRAQEQTAAGFNRDTATTNANILNQVDQFNAQT